MQLPVIEVYSDISCPYAYLSIHRLRQIWPVYANKIQLVWRSLSLEYINRQATAKPAHEIEVALFRQIDPDLPLQPWSKPEWLWPTTFWPALEALSCAQGQNQEAAFAISWALRRAFFAECRNPALRHEILAIAEEAAMSAPLDLAQFEADWDSGRYKEQVIEDSRRGWHTLKVNGSLTFVLPGGKQVTNPAIGEVYFDEQQHILRSYRPFAGDALSAFRNLLEAVICGAERG
ncbi:MAG: dithiol-disulfide isomerase [Chloroflexi bacterium]|nr:dithiol-disulfide isomerase [Chloroflexota bacterium]